MLYDHWSLFVINNISEKTYFTTLYIYIYIYILLYYFIFLSYIFVKVDCIDPPLKTMLITLSGSSVKMG